MRMSYVLVTGGSRNIGGAISRRLAHDGLRVISLDRVPPEDSDLMEWVDVDLSSPDATRAAVAAVLQRHGIITRLVNAVGVVRPATIDDITLADLDAVLSLNLRTAVQCMQMLAPGMRSAGFGRVASISSRTALGKELRTAYAASKAALHGVTRTWALELARHGITVNAVAPGTIETPTFFVNNPRDDPRTRAIIEGIPARRIGTPDDVAQAVSFFLDEKSGFVTGQVLYVCGGLTVGLAGG
jgi:3-oxoacyl-[acyl-carrier protein] reductase